MKLKFNAIFYIFILGLVLVSCKKDDDDAEPFDNEAQALLDDEELVDYLQTHYYIPPTADESFGVIDTILNGEASLFSMVQTENITYNDINFKLYYLISQDGVAGVYPSKTDRVLVKYNGFELDSTNFDKSTNFSWFDLTNTVTGWGYGLPFFKGGINTSEDGEPLAFENTGKGVIFFPSGLGYGEYGSGSIGTSAPLLFHIELALVQRADTDGDGIYDLYEDLDGNKDYNDDDTDEDAIPNYGDTDDDGDGILTSDENADPNGDGNPEDANDEDGDNIPDYLDSDS
ncbi:hypothetical protein JBL43_15105 [Aureibaculum sp. A20]|uniref:Peptidyl-prolyl cis-trans isomerase n=1 Tax=Aureibaculum flavum TaxID=2795986 RepID=A0ABS0WUB2_9FLAO|nr:FKBP-type peptidyl-prolyl cis-trans isomerase [Aureibaculum flavum]MBJ2175579.1 hypothetical protein [Aureibaculum flavum]